MEIPIWPGKTLLQTTSPWRYQRGTNVQQNSEIDSEMKDEGTEESVYLTRHRKSRDGKTLLFVHQTTWQRQLLKRYADVHCMLVRRYILNHQVPPPPLVLCCSEDKCGLPNSGIFCHSRWDDGVYNWSTWRSSPMEPWLECWLSFSQISANRKSMLSRVP